MRRACARLRQESGPVSISCLVKELTFEADHGYFWPNQATRITGNLCHWIDLAVFFLEEKPMPVSVTLSPRMPGTGPDSDEERVLTVTFDDGVPADSARHDPRRRHPRRAGADRHPPGQDHDHDRRPVEDAGRPVGIEHYSRTLFRDKAHTAMYREALGRVVAGRPAVYPVRDVVVVSAIQIAASNLARTDERTAELPDWLSLADQELL